MQLAGLTFVVLDPKGDNPQVYWKFGSTEFYYPVYCFRERDTNHNAIELRTGFPEFLAQSGLLQKVDQDNLVSWIKQQI